MRSDRAAPQPEVVNAGIESLSEGTNLLADGHGPSDGGKLRGEEYGLLSGVIRFSARAPLESVLCWYFLA
jgi:hypothetical protein